MDSKQVLGVFTHGKKRVGIGIENFGIGIDKFEVELELTKWN